MARQRTTTRSKSIKKKNTGSHCVFCHEPLNGSLAKTFTPPEGREPLPTGCGWSVCSEDCRKLPPNAEVFYRTSWRTK